MDGEPRPIDPELRETLSPGAKERLGMLEGFRSHFMLMPEVVYYPCCGDDITPWLAFDESRVIGVDIDEESVAELCRRGAEAICTDAELFEPPDADLVVSIGSHVMIEEMMGPAKEGRFIVTGAPSDAAYLLAVRGAKFKGLVYRNGHVDSNTQSDRLAAYTAGYFRQAIERDLADYGDEPIDRRLAENRLYTRLKILGGLLHDEELAKRGLPQLGFYVLQEPRS